MRGGRARAVALLQRFSYVLGQWPSDPFLLFFFFSGPLPSVGLGDSPAEMVGIPNSYAMCRNLGQLFTAIKGPDGPAFVVRNDDSSDRLAVDADIMA